MRPDIFRQVVWSERGAEPGIMSAGLDGSDPRWLVRRRVRRVGALALHEPSRRVFFVDAFFDTLESVRLDGGGRLLLATFALRPDAAAAPPHLHPPAELYAASSVRSAVVAQTRVCARMAVWEEWVWCATRRGLTRLARRLPLAPPAPRARRPLSALAVLHAVLTPDDPGGLLALLNTRMLC